MTNTKKFDSRLRFEELRKLPENRTPVTFLGCPTALKVVKYDCIDMNRIAPTDPELHNGVRIGGIDQMSVNEFVRRIEAGSYDPFIEEPPCVTLLPKTHPMYKEGYRYQTADGHHRIEAHIQLSINKIEVAIIEFLPMQGETSEFWRIAFMIEKNDPKKGRFHRKASTNEDLEQAKNLLLATATTKVIDTPTEQDGEYVKTKLRIATEAQKLADLLGVSAVSQIRDIEESLFRAAANNDSDIMKHVVHYYSDYHWNKHIVEVCTKHSLHPDNLLVRPYYRKDADCSRDDYNQFIQLVTEGMKDIDNLKGMAMFGQVRDCTTDKDVYATRKRKLLLVDNMVKYIEQLHTWLNVKRNYKAITAVPMYFLTQTYTETKKYGTGYVGTVDSDTGQVTSTKKPKKGK